MKIANLPTELMPLALQIDNTPGVADAVAGEISVEEVDRAIVQHFVGAQQGRPLFNAQDLARLAALRSSTSIGVSSASATIAAAPNLERLRDRIQAVRVAALAIAGKEFDAAAARDAGVDTVRSEIARARDELMEAKPALAPAVWQRLADDWYSMLQAISGSYAVQTDGFNNARSVLPLLDGDRAFSMYYTNQNQWRDWGQRLSPYLLEDASMRTQCGVIEDQIASLERRVVSKDEATKIRLALVGTPAIFRQHIEKLLPK